ncbi:MAG TPA: secondary thiamine-phosphate synthase enzyme YjbQ, partial [Acidimicrobiales bacterium]|nr:secondary thiamine-phosphate synthase enzyme YjbQ [Acidimicrobiales bacterium]
MDQMAMADPVRLAVSSDSPFQLLDLTERVAGVVAGAGLHHGIVHVFCPHTSCGLAVTELEDGLHADFEGALARLAPVDGEYAHDDMGRRRQNLEPDERHNGWSHIRGLLATQPAVSAPILDGALALGRWQRLFLVELDGPRPERTVVVQCWGAAGSAAW